MHFQIGSLISALIVLARCSDWYQMYIDELPIWGMLGEYMMAEVPGAAGAPSTVKEQGFLYTHKEFSISYNGRQIIEVNLTSENPRPIVPSSIGALTFSVNWVPTTKTFEKRFDRYLDFDFFEHQIHWFSIFNSFMMVRALAAMRASEFSGVSELLLTCFAICRQLLLNCVRVCRSSSCVVLSR